LAFHSNYGHILYHFRDKARCWSKVAIFQPAFVVAVSGLESPPGPSEYYRTPYGYAYHATMSASTLSEFYSLRATKARLKVPEWQL